MGNSHTLHVTALVTGTVLCSLLVPTTEPCLRKQTDEPTSSGDPSIVSVIITAFPLTTPDPSMTSITEVTSNMTMTTTPRELITVNCSQDDLEMAKSQHNVECANEGTCTVSYLEGDSERIFSCECSQFFTGFNCLEFKASKDELDVASTVGVVVAGIIVILLVVGVAVVVFRLRKKRSKFSTTPKSGQQSSHSMNGEGSESYPMIDGHPRGDSPTGPNGSLDAA